MLIDWFTVGAQALNFMILVWALRHFLYRPVLGAIDAREKKIAAELADAAAKEAEAQKQRDDFQHKNEDLDQRRAALLKEATEGANTERQRLLDEARKAADALRDKRREALRHDAHNLNRAIMRRTQREVFAIARKALADLSSATLEERMAEVFVRRVQDMDAPTKATLAEASRKAAGPVVVRSAFDLAEKERTAIQGALSQALSSDACIHFETAPELVSGIEYTTSGHKVGWSIADYLGSLEKGVTELLEERETAEAKEEPKRTPGPEASKAEATPKPKPDASPAPKPEATPAAKAESKPANTSSAAKSP